MDRNANSYLGEAPIRKLMLKFSIPCVMSLLVSSLYNLVDQIFIGWGVGYLGNGATNVVFPITVIALALALLIGDGCAVNLSICQGKGDTESANKSVGNAIVLMITAGVGLMIVFMLFRDPILHLFGATENNIGYAIDYFNVITLGIPFFVFTNGINSTIRADGSPGFAMGSTLVGCIMNIILDPIAIFVLGWGVTGAAVATIAGQIVSALLGVYYLFHTKTFALTKSSLKLKAGIVKTFLPMGISSFLTQVSIVTIMGVMNTTLVRYGALSKFGEDIPMTVMGIVMKVFNLMASIVIGIAVGCQPVVGYNYGAGKTDRVKKIFKMMCVAALTVGVVSLIAFECFPVQIISLFGSEGELYNEFAMLTCRIFMMVIPLFCLQKIFSIFMQSLGKPLLSMFFSLLRDFILIVPLALILPSATGLGVVGTLYAGPVSDAFAFIITAVIIFGMLKKMKPAR